MIKVFVKSGEERLLDADPVEIREYEYSGVFGGVGKVTCKFYSPKPVAFSVDDYIEFRGEKYKLYEKPEPSKKADVNSYGGAFECNLVFEHILRDLDECAFLDYVVNDNKVHYSGFSQPSFYGTAADLALRIERNLQRLYIGWTITVDPSFDGGLKNIEVKDLSCLGALTLFGSLFKAGMTVTGKSIEIGAPAVRIPELFLYKDGLISIESSVDQNVRIVTRLKAYGSKDNLPLNYNKGIGVYPESFPAPGLMLPNSSQAGIDYIESNKKSIYGIREAVLYFDGSNDLEKIYPTIKNMTAERLAASGIHVGSSGYLDEVVSSETVVSEEQVNVVVKIKDIGFNINDYLGDGAVMVMESGECIGSELQIVKVEEDPNSQGYLVTVERKSEGDFFIPNQTQNIKAGDKFILTGIEMPSAYVKAAEQRLLQEARAWLSENDHEPKIYTPKLDDIRIKEDGIILKEGMVLAFTDADLGIAEELLIQTLNIKYGGPIPTHEITLGEKGRASFMDRISRIVRKEYASAIASFSGSQFLSKVHSDAALGLIRFLAGAEFGSFSSGMFTGKGGRIDPRGNAEFESIKARSFLEVPEIRYNRLTLVGEEIAVGAGGIIEKVSQPTDPETGLPIDSNLYNIWLKLEEGEMNPFRPLDIVKGIFNQIGAFRTSWFHINSIDGNKMSITVAADTSVPAGMNFPPKQFMNIAKVGNFIDEKRQASIFLSAKDGNIHMLDGVDNYGGGFKSFQLGKLDGLENIIDFDKHTSLDKSHGYLYARGILVEDIIEVDYLGAPKRKLRDRGMWSLDTAQTDPYRFTDTLQDEAWMPNGKYRCLTDETLEMPSIGSPDWVRVVEIRHEEYSRKSTTFFAKPLVYNVGDTWFLTRDEIVHNIFYRKGTMLHAAYNTGAESDWRQVIYEPDSSSPVNLLRNHDLRFPDFQNWGGVGQSAEIQISELPTEFYKTGFNIISDEWGFNYPIIDENGNEIEL